MKIKDTLYSSPKWVIAGFIYTLSCWTFSQPVRVHLLRIHGERDAANSVISYTLPDQIQQASQIKSIVKKDSSYSLRKHFTFDNLRACYDLPFTTSTIDIESTNHEDMELTLADEDIGFALEDGKLNVLSFGQDDCISFDLIELLKKINSTYHDSSCHAGKVKKAKASPFSERNSRSKSNKHSLEKQTLKQCETLLNICSHLGENAMFQITMHPTTKTYFITIIEPVKTQSNLAVTLIEFGQSVWDMLDKETHKC
jgi:hypothetical protein